ncbi:beta-aspartyl-peptidase (threonine type) [Rhizoctonia solani AG-1 IB]|uniref:Beta-aspartyl-peptidase (Threonine type) n=1 Tax=Thanatephorus cucumeris (strain AG1-IB / isolate 7/3/14) TaxID=1108050 RepID=A0A0B7FH67_THACB|nr:beta-aspartyl-peptidase (threonine type) [Rhizoctonia solani AG-1 IB]
MILSYLIPWVSYPSITRRRSQSQPQPIPPYSVLNNMSKRGSNESLVEKQSLAAHTFKAKSGPVLVIHGGAGLLLKKDSTPAQRELYKAVLREALIAGNNILQSGGQAIDAAVAAVTVLEDSPLFNAAHGAVFNVAGKNELEASVMLSHPPPSHPSIPASRKGLSLTLLTRAKNPSQMARALYLEPSLAPHAFLSGPAAEEIGYQVGQELVDPSYYWTEHRWREHRRELGLPETSLPGEPGKDIPYPPLDQLPTGTVGAVALDVNGHIACCTSTGGKTNKLVGRVGDTPSMGSGFWAETWSEDNKGIWARVFRAIGKDTPITRAVGVSGTGDGDYFIREATAVTLARRMRYQGKSLQSAAQDVVEDLRQAGGLGGVIALDNLGNVAMPMNSTGMYRGVIDNRGEPKVAIFDDDTLE